LFLFIPDQYFAGEQNWNLGLNQSTCRPKIVTLHHHRMKVWDLFIHLLSPELTVHDRVSKLVKDLGKINPSA
jgi:hypothetical protein